MMKKLFLLIAIGLIFSTQAADAGLISTWKENNAVKKEIKATENEIKNIFDLQIKYSTMQDCEKLKEFYAENYRNSDAFDKNTTFKIIKDNYELYPELKMTTKINSINLNGNYATVDVYEYAEAKNLEREEIDLKGYLEAFAHTIYYMEKINGKWLITAERAIEENNSIIFGEAQYLAPTLTAPMIIGAGDTYTSTLSINNLPRKALVMGYITQSPAIFPLKEEDQDAFRVMDDTELERIFIANKKNINEYNIASIGITRSQPLPNGGMKLYLSGLAFLMTRVDVVPENLHYEKVKEDTDE